MVVWCFHPAFLDFNGQFADTLLFLVKNDFICRICFYSVIRTPLIVNYKPGILVGAPILGEEEER